MRKLILTSVIALLPFTAFAHDEYNPCDEGYEPVEYIIAWAHKATTIVPEVPEVQDKLDKGYKLYGDIANGGFIIQPMVKCGRK